MNGVETVSDFQVLRCVRSAACVQVTMTRSGQQPNRIDERLLRELLALCDQVESDPACRLVVLRGSADAFCLGMDFDDVTRQLAATAADALGEKAALFMDTLRRIGTCSRVFACVIEGRALGGGVGLAAACDIAVATETATFGLPELLWGLLPANILPYLIRRMGYQKAYWLSLTTQTISAKEAHASGLIDAVTAEPDEYLRRLLLRLARVDPESVLDLKRYMKRMWLIDERMKSAAIEEFARLVGTPRVQSKLSELARAKTGAVKVGAL